MYLKKKRWLRIFERIYSEKVIRNFLLYSKKGLIFLFKLVRPKNWTWYKQWEGRRGQREWLWLATRSNIKKRTPLQQDLRPLAVQKQWLAWVFSLRRFCIQGTIQKSCNQQKEWVFWKFRRVEFSINEIRETKKFEGCGKIVLSEISKLTKKNEK